MGYDYPDMRHYLRFKGIRMAKNMHICQTPLSDKEYDMLNEEEKDCFIKVDYW